MNNLTVVAFYPGGGGNRYRRLLEGKSFSEPNRVYDDLFKDQSFVNRYLTRAPDVTGQRFVLTHCLNYSHIVQQLNPSQVFVILTDFKKSLLREWKLNGFSLYQNRVVEDQPQQLINTYNAIKDPGWPDIDGVVPDQYMEEVVAKLQEFKINDTLDSAWETIKWHHEYYKQYPIEVGHATVVSDRAFNTVMDQELNSYHSDVFDFCWQTYTDLGPKAPVVDLHNIWQDQNKSLARNENSLLRSQLV